MKMPAKIDKNYKAAFITQSMQLKNCTVSIDPKDNSVVVLYDDGKTTFIISGQITQTFIKT
jgi:predicted transcriptional regulator